MRIRAPKSTIRYGTPKELGLSRDEYLPKVRKLFSDNSKSLISKISKDDLKGGTLRTFPFFEFFDEWLVYQADTLQLAVDKIKGVVGFFGSPMKLPNKIAQWCLKHYAQKEIDKIPELKEALNEPGTVIYFNSDLCVDKDFRRQGIGKNLKLNSEECLKKLHSVAKGAKKIILLTAHETDNLASSKTQDSLGYHTILDNESFWPLSMKLTVRAKIIDVPNYSSNEAKPKKLVNA